MDAIGSLNDSMYSNCISSFFYLVLLELGAVGEWDVVHKIISRSISILAVRLIDPTC